MLRLILFMGDSRVLVVSIILVFVLEPQFHLGLHVTWNEPKTWDLKLMWGCIALATWSVAVTITKAQDLDCASSPFKSSLSALYALVLMLISWMLFTYPFIAGRIASDATVLLLFLVVAAPALSAWRVALAEFMSLPRFRRRAVIVGASAAGETIAKEFQSTKRPGANVLGYISDSTDNRSQEDGLPILGDRSTLRHLARSGMIDMIIMALNYNVNPELFHEAIEAAQLGISVVPMTKIYERMSGKVPVEHISDQWYAALPSEIVLTPFYLCWHRALDLIFGICGLLTLVIFLPILALLIYLDSPGSIFYVQERIGYQGKKFSIYKFRSMRIDAEYPRGAIWAAKYDTRVTRVGRFLRATHLDELPQVLNLLRGEMSLIGPRPERQMFVNQLEKTLPFYRCRLSTKPGLTGWAQVRYPYARSDQDALAKLQYDLYYIKHQSFTLDILIILKTVGEVLRHRGT